MIKGSLETEHLKAVVRANESTSFPLKLSVVACHICLSGNNSWQHLKISSLPSGLALSLTHIYKENSE
jgi:hypothetical protein